jgi:hypothetical protein
MHKNASAPSTQIREFVNNFAIAKSIHNHTVNMQKSSALKHAPCTKIGHPVFDKRFFYNHLQSRRQQTNGCRGVDLSMRHICRSNPQMHTAFENLMIHVHLQIAITIALRCVLHRRGNRGIPCQNFCFLIKDFVHRHTFGWSKKNFYV